MFENHWSLGYLMAWNKGFCNVDCCPIGRRESTQGCLTRSVTHYKQFTTILWYEVIYMYLGLFSLNELMANFCILLFAFSNMNKASSWSCRNGTQGEKTNPLTSMFSFFIGNFSELCICYFESKKLSFTLNQINVQFSCCSHNAQFFCVTDSSLAQKIN